MLDVIFALAAGVLTIAAPCILPMLPILLGATIGNNDPLRPVFITLGFTLAFSAIAFVFGIFPSVLGLSPEILRDTAIVLLVAFGLLMLWPRPFEHLMSRLNGVVAGAAGAASRLGSGRGAAVALGASLGVVWAPCAGPVLGSILTLIAASRDLGWAALLLICYAVGASVPMLIIAYGGQFVSTRIRRIVPHAHRLQQGFGVAVIGVAVAMYYQYDSVITVWLSYFYPDIQQGL